MKNKFNLTGLLTVAILFAATFAQAQISTPQPSTAGSVSGNVGLTTISVDYSRPGVKGRTIFGEGGIVPFDQIWRTGANSGSKITFSTDVTFGGKEVAAGTYLIFSVPAAESWDVMLYSDISLGGNAAGYKEENEVARIKATTEMLAKSVERLTFNIADVSADNTTANVRLEWANTAVNMPVVVSFDDIIMAEIAAKTKVNPGNLIAAANYYFSTGKDMEQALTWINTYLATDQNSAQFWNVHLKAQILSTMGNKKEAIATAEASLAAAKANADGDFGYTKRNEDLIASLKKK
ncbi:MAG: hypothetical protein ACI8QD_000555 [Cyclobacteriaceae bacterium]|jgi:hypothetical protein